MTVHIEEINAELASSPQHDGGGTDAGRPVAPQDQQTVLELLQLAQARKARLVVD